MINFSQASALSTRLRWPLVLSSVLGMIVLIEDAQGESNDAIARRIIAAWKERQDKIGTVQAEVVEDCAVKAKVFQLPASSSRQPVSYSTTKVTTVILDFMQNRQRYEVRGGFYNLKLGRVVEHESVTVLRNGERKTFTNSPTYREQGLPAAGQGVVSAGKDYSAMLGNIHPLLWYVRPLGADLPGMGRFDPSRDLHVIGHSRVNGSNVIECRLSGPLGGRLWIDPQKDHVVVRVRGRMQETTVTYSSGNLFRAVPKEWTLVHFSQDGSIRQSKSSRIQKLTFNQTMDESLFEFAFPKGTIVHHVGGGGVNPTMVATGEGGLRPLDSHEQSATRGVWRWFLWGNVLIVLALAVFLLHRRIRHAA